MPVTLNASTSSGLIQTADTSGTIELQSNGTTRLTVASTGAYGQLVSGTAQASTSGTAVDFTGIPSWVKRITVMFSGVSTNGTSNILVQLGDAGGFETTGYSSNNAIIVNAASPTVTTSTVGFNLTSSFAAANAYNGHALITKIDGNTWVSSSSFGAGSPQVGQGSKSLSETLDRVRITTVNGTDTFDAGTINILYEG